MLHTQLKFVHRGWWYKIDVFSKRIRFQCKDHALQDHLLGEVWHPEGGLTETIYKGPERLILFLSDVEER